MRKPWDHSKYSFLFAKFQTRLEPNHVVQRSLAIVLPQLYDCIIFCFRFGMSKPDGLQRPKRRVSIPRFAIDSTGMQPSYRSMLSKSFTSAQSAWISAS